MSNESIEELYDIILKLQSQEDCKIFFEDLLTYKELENLSQRVEAAKLLKEGMTYVQIQEKTGIANQTLSRVSKSLKMGEGYKKFVN
ncbi:MAG: TrpR YerC/YecD [Clostridia bacterium]|nr:TrpR YerC/YecD [Clostridia bacterium]